MYIFAEEIKQALQCIIKNKKQQNCIYTTVFNQINLLIKKIRK